MSLVHNTSAGQFVYTETIGGKVSTWIFWDYVQTADPQGAFYQYIDPLGNITQVTAYNFTTAAEIQRTYTVNGSTIIYSLVFYGETGGPSWARVQNVVLRSSPDGVTWTKIRQVWYGYYHNPYNTGNGFDHETEYVQTTDGPGYVIDSWYYRYYITSASPGYWLAPKFVVNPRSYARLTNAYPGTAIDSLTDAQIAPYADNYFEYDSQCRVTKEIAQGSGCSCSGGNGQGTFTYAYSTNGNSGYSDGLNTWKYKTVETLPDSNTNTVYANYMGQVMLKVFTDTTSGNQWATFWKYDSDGNKTWEAEPSAVLPPTSGDTYDAHNDLLNSVSGNYQYLSDSAGLIHIYDYALSTTATRLCLTDAVYGVC